MVKSKTVTTLKKLATENQLGKRGATDTKLQEEEILEDLEFSGSHNISKIEVTHLISQNSQDLPSPKSLTERPNHLPFQQENKESRVRNLLNKVAGTLEKFDRQMHPLSKSRREWASFDNSGHGSS